VQSGCISPERLYGTDRSVGSQIVAPRPTLLYCALQPQTTCATGALNADRLEQGTAGPTRFRLELPFHATHGGLDRRRILPGTSAALLERTAGRSRNLGRRLG